MPFSIDVLEELSAIRLGDRRLSSRARRILQALRRSPDSSLPAVFASSTELDAAYGFFNNPKVVPASLLHPHIEATLDRLSGQGDWLCIHDTSEMAYDGPRLGLGPLCDHGQGYLAHFSLCASAGPVPLPFGVAALELLTRPARRRKKKTRKAKYSLDFDNEHARWERAIAVVEKSARRHQLPAPIHVLDREGDSYLLFAQMLEHSRRFIMRLTHNRTLSGEHASRSLTDALAERPHQSVRELFLSARQPEVIAPDAKRKHPPRTERVARVVISSECVALKRPHAAPNWLPSSLTVNVVRVHEPNPPPGEPAIEWRLATSDPIESAAQVEQIVDWYRRRWLIEEFFGALKGGCAVLERQFEQAHALQNILALSIPIAWQMLALRTLAHHKQEAPASRVLTSQQVALIVAASQALPVKQRAPDNPTARQALLAIAALGGHVLRNGEPGWKTLARGFQRVREWETFLPIAQKYLNSE